MKEAVLRAIARQCPVCFAGVGAFCRWGSALAPKLRVHLHRLAPVDQPSRPLLGLEHEDPEAFRAARGA